MKLKLELDVDDNFEKGQCYDCPLSYNSYFGDDYTPICIISRNYETCPLEVIKD